jgi:hypothetical protein
MAFSVGGLLLGIINHRHRGVSVAVPALVQKLYIALVVLIAVYMVVALIFGLPSWAGTVKHRLPMVLRPSPLRHVRLGRHRSFGATMTDHEQALRAARDSCAASSRFEIFCSRSRSAAKPLSPCSIKPRVACLKCWKYSTKTTGGEPSNS